MGFFKLLRKKSKIIYISLVATSVLNGLANLVLINFINNKIAGTSLPFFAEFEWLIFCMLIAGTFTLNKLFETFMIKLTNDIKFDYQQRIHRKLQTSSFEQFEMLGRSRVYTAINDSQQLAALPEMVMTLINATILISVCIVYLFLTSALGAMMIISVMAALLILYLVKNQRIEIALRMKRELQNYYYSYIDDLLNGFKEIKTSRNKNKNIHLKFLDSNVRRVKEIEEKTLVSYNNNELYAKFSWYIVIGVILFIGPHVALNNTMVTSFMITILFMMGPIGNIIGTLQAYTDIKIVLSRQQEFDSILQNIPGSSAETDVSTAMAITSDDQLSEVVITDITYTYYDDKNEKTFCMGPVTLTIKKQEIIFVHGGNGSGKSTFINILCGLYTPHAGRIILRNGSGVAKTNIADFVSVVFTSAFLFSQNYENYFLDETNQRLQYFLRLFQMQNVVRFNEATGTLKGDLSKGQQKRLALILALLEDKPIIVLDEWAAEQDPEFRSYFYRNILPELKKDGRTIVAVTHDDGYFNCCDRLIRFDFGKISSDISNAKFSLSTEGQLYP